MAIEITNKEECDVIYGFELTDDEKKNFDYHSPEDLEEQIFVRYRTMLYDISQFIRLGYGMSQERINQGKYHPFGEEWNDGAYHCDTYFSGTLCKILDTETILMAQYYCNDKE